MDVRIIVLPFCPTLVHRVASAENFLKEIVESSLLMSLLINSVNVMLMRYEKKCNELLRIEDYWVAKKICN